MPRLRQLENVDYRVLVTGSRGKSSVVRLLHAAFESIGIESWARITGVEPRELQPSGERLIQRTAGAHVEEMRWWLKRLSPTAGAVVLENSAVTPEFQGLAAQWLKPDITVFTNDAADHQEAWGSEPRAAAVVLAESVPEAGQVVLPASLENDSVLTRLLERRSCSLFFAPRAGENPTDVKSINLGLAVEVIRRLGLPDEPALAAMESHSGDCYDFRVVNRGGAELALAFSANDLSSTRKLFDSLGWDPMETCLVYNHRRDRPERFRAFAEWLRPGNWRDRLIIGDRPPGLRAAGFRKLKDGKSLESLFKPGDRVFGCGNIAGLPLTLY